MVRRLFVALALAVLGAGGAHGAASVVVKVNATVVPVCKFFTAAPVVNIRNTGVGSNIDPSLATTASGNAAIVYRCTNGTAPTFTIPATTSVTCAACTGTPSMTATVTSSNNGAGTGMGAGHNRTLTVTGQITQATFQNARAGAYKGTMTVTVTP